MKKIYLMRHGETLFNTMDVNQGQCDSPLTENGIRQAKAAKAWFDAHNVHFDAVYTRPPFKPKEITPHEPFGIYFCASS